VGGDSGMITPAAGGEEGTSSLSLIPSDASDSILRKCSSISGVYSKFSKKSGDLDARVADERFGEDWNEETETW
jgi:hypothetical protein